MARLKSQNKNDTPLLEALLSKMIVRWRLGGDVNEARIKITRDLPYRGNDRLREVEQLSSRALHYARRLSPEKLVAPKEDKRVFSRYSFCGSL